jgi:predicted DNA-binding helix-hairpin-helix protein
MDVQRKLEILADAAKYDASCASSGSEKRDSSEGKGMGSTAPGMGICHSYAPDGRCISLLKVLLTNACHYDCLYCVNRTSSNVPRARFTVDEVVKLTLDFYRRNYIEGLFLSSGIIRSADYSYCVIGFLRNRCAAMAPQQGHRVMVLLRARLNRTRRVAIEFGTWRSGRNGGSSGSITIG